MKDAVSNTWTRPFAKPERMPLAADVVIIGGGIVGVCTAWFLARQAVDVVLCEKGHIAGEQSGRNWGWVRKQGRDVREMPMIVESLEIWRTLADEIGEDVGFVQTGCLFAASSDEELNDFSSWLPTADEYGVDTRVVDADELGQLVPGSAVAWRGALYTASDGRAEPHKAAPAIARAAVREGATVLTACAVRGIETEGGRVASQSMARFELRRCCARRAPGRRCSAGRWTLRCRN